MSEVTVASSGTKQLGTLKAGIWLQKGHDDVHLQLGGEVSDAFIIGHNVNQCREDKCSREALVIDHSGKCTIQVVDPKTREVTIKDVAADVVYDELQRFLFNLRQHV